MTHYCGNCTEHFGQPVEMHHIDSGFGNETYQCPMCTRIKRIRDGIAEYIGADEVRKMREESPGVLGVVIASVLIGLLGGK